MNNLYKYKRVIQEINYLKKNFKNWDSILKRAIQGKNYPRIEFINGIVLDDGNPNTLSIYREIFHHKVYQSPEIKIEQNDIVFDVGANIGLFSIYASQFTKAGIYAFEPHPINFKKLERNLSNNNLNVKAIKCAISGEVGTGTLTDASISGGHILKMDSLSNNHDNLKVEVVTLNHIMDQYGIDRIDFLKLDCEGAEGEILNKLSDTLFSKIKKIVLEFHDNQSILSHDQIIDLLRIKGFSTKLDWNKKSYFGYIYAWRK